MNQQRSRTFWLLTQLVFLVAVVGAGWASGDLVLGLVCGGVVLLSLVAFAAASRRGWSVAGITTGVGDEREGSIYREAGFRTGEMLMYLLALWGVVSVARGDDNETLMAILVLFAVLWIGNVSWLAVTARRPLRRSRG